jgi:hypothetical protein
MLSKILRNPILISVLFLGIAGVANAQSSDAQNIKYRRSSLSMILLDTGEFKHAGDFKYKNVIINGWEKYPFPDKYDKNEIATTIIDITYDTLRYTKLPDKQRKYTESQIRNLKTQNATICKAIAEHDKKLKNLKERGRDTSGIANLKKEKNIAIASNNEKILRLKQGRGMDPYQAYNDSKKDIGEAHVYVGEALRKQRIGNQLVREWFSSKDSSGNGKMFDMSTIQKRGFYDASMLDVRTAQSGIRGMAALADAGEELINNTFVSVTSLEFIDNKILAEALNAIADVAENSSLSYAGAIGGLLSLGISVGTRIAAAAIKDGYSVFSKTYLYKLTWNDSIAAEFYNIWGDEEAFDKMDFPIEFVGGYYERSVINAGVFNKEEDRKAEQVLSKVLVRNIDKVFATLQRENDVFKPKVPILSTSPITAEIGMKEGLEGGEKFEVLEMTQDPNTGRTNWVRIGTTTADKNFIWDNRYNAGDEPEKPVMDANGKPITVSTFTRVGGAQPGMLLRQIK